MVVLYRLSYKGKKNSRPKTRILEVTKTVILCQYPQSELNNMRKCFYTLPMKYTNNTRFSRAYSAIEQDFAEHIKFSLDSDIYHTSMHGRYNALAYAIRDRIIHQWDLSRKAQIVNKAKRINYLSLEFLMGRAMTNNINNMQLNPEVRKALADLGYTLEEIVEQEPDAGLGNGGLGRLAACYLDSLATLQIPAIGYGIRYNYGIFKQEIADGWQVEKADDWLRAGNPWEILRNDLVYTVNFGGKVQIIKEKGRDCYKWVDTEKIIGYAYDTPIVGYGGAYVNTLRLWSAAADEDFDFSHFNSGDYTDAVRAKNHAENISKVLYPNDKLYTGKELRLKQQYFFVACSLSDIIRRFKEYNFEWSEFKNFAAIQLNDTHPSIAVAELMRKLVDEEGLEWDQAWDITQSVMGYTNHTLMPEALEKWPVPMFEKLLPRHLQIIYEINRRHLIKSSAFFPLESEKIAKLSIIEESNPKQIRMANLAIVGSHAVNGVAELHSKLLRDYMFPEFNILNPGKFINVTNGITQRRWLLSANPALSKLITDAIGDGWISDFSKISGLEKYIADTKFLKDFDKVKYKAKLNAADFLKKDCGLIIDPDSFIDVQCKRIHEYKRQSLNILDVIIIYDRLRNDLDFRRKFPKTTFLFGGKAAPGYVNAKLIIKFINNVAEVINEDTEVNDKINVHFMPNYRVTMAEAIIPATNLSQQISTAGTEASGTGNMKFMVNGAITLGTMDGANIEIAEEVGMDNIFIFGKTSDEIHTLKSSGYNPEVFIKANPELERIRDMIKGNMFSWNEPGIFDPIIDMLFTSDRYFHMADIETYHAQRLNAVNLYTTNRTEWNRMAVTNIAHSGKFSSDRSIQEYCDKVWNIKPCCVEREDNVDSVLQDVRKEGLLFK